MNALRTGLVLATIAFAACAMTAADIGPEGALTVVRETLKTKGRNPAEYGTKVEEGTAMGKRCYVVAVWPRVAENPGWEEYFVAPDSGRILGHAYVD